MSIALPAFCLVVLMGPSGAGKSTFAARHFGPTEVVSSDRMRGWIADDPDDQSATGDAFELLHALVAKRLRRGRLTVVDATNVESRARKPLFDLARVHHAQVVVLVSNPGIDVCRARNARRVGRTVPDEAIVRHHRQLESSLRDLRGRAGRRLQLIELDSAEAMEHARITRVALPPMAFAWHPGPFDIIGDVHGCLGELRALVARLGYDLAPPGEAGRWCLSHPDGRTLVFVGDVIDRGPESAECLRLAIDLVGAGDALMAMGNHEAKLLRVLRGSRGKMAHGLAETWAQIQARDDAFANAAERFLAELTPHLVLDDGRLVVAHAGLEAHLHGRVSPRAESFALYGKTTGESDRHGLPVRLDWAADYAGDASVVYGHTPRATAAWVNGTICIDTGCVFGNRLSALRWPEKTLVEVPAERMWSTPRRPLMGHFAEAQPRRLRLAEVLEVAVPRDAEGTRDPSVVARVREALAAQRIGGEVADPRSLVWCPPTVPPGGTARRDAWLEHVEVAVAALRNDGAADVVCLEAAPERRVAALVMRDPALACERFGLPEPSAGAVVDSAGRTVAMPALVAALAAAATRAGLWDDLGRAWLCVELALPATAGAATAELAALGAAREALLAIPGLAGEAAELAAHLGTLAVSPPSMAVAERPRLLSVVGGADGYAALRPWPWQAEHLGALAAHAAGAFELAPATVVRSGEPVDRAWADAASTHGALVRPWTGLRARLAAQRAPWLAVRGAAALAERYGRHASTGFALELARRRRLGHVESIAVREWRLAERAFRAAVNGAGVVEHYGRIAAQLSLRREPVDRRLL